MAQSGETQITNLKNGHPQQGVEQELHAAKLEALKMDLEFKRELQAAQLGNLRELHAAELEKLALEGFD
ncbi:hypothetical protein B7463_g11114, partial [Scytalidium lignicola]